MRTRRSLAVHVAGGGARAAVGRRARGLRERRHAARGEHEAGLQHVRPVRRVVVCAGKHTHANVREQHINGPNAEASSFFYFFSLSMFTTVCSRMCLSFALMPFRSRTHVLDRSGSSQYGIGSRNCCIGKVKDLLGCQSAAQSPIACIVCCRNCRANYLRMKSARSLRVFNWHNWAN